MGPCSRIREVVHEELFRPEYLELRGTCCIGRAIGRRDRRFASKKGRQDLVLACRCRTLLDESPVILPRVFRVGPQAVHAMMLRYVRRRLGTGGAIQGPKVPLQPDQR